MLHIFVVAPNFFWIMKNDRAQFHETIYYRPSLSTFFRQKWKNTTEQPTKK